MVLLERYGAALDAVEGLAPKPSSTVDRPENSSPDPHEVLGYRPDGTPVTIANTAHEWEGMIEDALAGRNTRPAIEALRAMRERLNA